MRKVIAIDFDGCLCENAWPEIGAPHMEVIDAALQAQEKGAALVLWTCRNGDLLASAVEWCRERGLVFDTVNENLPERLDHYGTDTRKISADEYWDDCAVRVPAPPNDQLTISELREMADEIADDFISYVICGVQNAAPYCANMRPECCERPGWCTGYSKLCKGFFPKAYRRKPEEGET